MNLDSGKLMEMKELDAKIAAGEQKRADWREVPEGATDQDIEALQQPMNRKQRRKALADLRRRLRKAGESTGG